MKKTFIIRLPDKAGTFLEAVRVISRHGGDISRVNYNKAVDVYALFLDVHAEKADIDAITEELSALGYLSYRHPEEKTVLLNLHLYDHPSALLPILQLFCRYGINICYMNSSRAEEGFQNFKVGFMVEDPAAAKKMHEELTALCEVTVLDFSMTERLLDSTVFYLQFAQEIAGLFSLSNRATMDLVIHSNEIMQMLENRNENPRKTFKYIRRYAEFISEHQRGGFRPILKTGELPNGYRIYMLEPPCGSNTYTIEKEDGELLLIDGGFHCYLEETAAALREQIPDFDSRKKTLLLTHADMDHTGLWPLFDEIWASGSCLENFRLEREGKKNFREQNPMHAPYCRLSAIITDYTVPDEERLRSLGDRKGDGVLEEIGQYTFGDMTFRVLEGNGGHVRGETVYFCEEQKLVFTGDIYVNILGFSKDQGFFNRLAPYLMSSVNVDSAKATACRKALIASVRGGGYLMCPGHGEWTVM